MTSESDFIFTCKPGSHQLIEEYVSGIDLASHKVRRKNKRNQFETYHFKWLRQVPIRDGSDALKVNWFSVRVTRKNKTLYKNRFLTSLPVSKANVETLVKAGRSRWRIENENFNTLKTQGYRAEHNFGHGKKGLANTLFQLKLLAFSFHTLSDLLCHSWRTARKYWVARYHFFELLRSYVRAWYFNSWSELLEFLQDKRAPPR